MTLSFDSNSTQKIQIRPYHPLPLLILPFNTLPLTKKPFLVFRNTIKWLDDWENETIRNVKEVEAKKLTEIEIEIRKLEGTSTNKKTLKELKKSAVKNINEKYKGTIDSLKSNFLSTQTAEGLRVTLRSIIDLSKYLLTYCDFKYVLTVKLNQDCLEVKTIKIYFHNSF